MAEVKYPRITIEYCTQCRWMFRAVWYAQELLTTFNGDLNEVSLLPGLGGRFLVTIQLAQGQEPTLLWDRKEQSRFPEAKELKQLVRDVIDPQRSLGHSDKPVMTSRSQQVVQATATYDGPAVTMEDRPAHHSSTQQAEHKTHKLDASSTTTEGDAKGASSSVVGAVGPATSIDDRPVDAKSLDEIKHEAKALKQGHCADCE